MKKFFISLLILIIAAGIVFYFGWVQIEIPPDHYAVIFTKTGGYDEVPVRPGVFTWRWEKLFPTNMTIYTFPIHNRTADIHISGNLPSAEIYSTVLQEDYNFTFDILLTLTYSLKSEKLPDLVKTGHFTPETIESLFVSMENSAGGVLSRFLFSSLNQKKNHLDFPDEFEQELTREFPDFEFHSISLKKMDFPDIDLYLSAKEAYLALLNAKNSIVVAETKKAALNKASNENRIEILRQYGELLTDYPIILDYLTLGLDQEFLFESLGVEGAE